MDCKAVLPNPELKIQPRKAEIVKRPEIHKLVLVNDSNLPQMEIYRAPLARDARTETTPISEPVKGRLGALFGQMPGMLVSGANLATNRYVLSFSAEVSRGLNNGTYQLAKAAGGGLRALAVGTDGKIAEQGVLAASKGLQIGAAAAGLWQLAAVVTAQKFLADINQSLQRLENGLGEIKAMLEGEVIGKVQGNVDYMMQWYRLLQRQELELDRYTFVNDTLEHIEREFCQLWNGGLHVLKDRIEAIQSVEFSGSRLKTNSNKFTDMFKSITNAWQRQVTMLAGRLAAVQFKMALGCDRALLPQRIDGICQQFAEMQASFQSVRALASAKISTMEGFWRREKTERRYQAELGNKVEASLAELSGAMDSLQKANARLQKALQLGRPGAEDAIQFEITLTPTGEVASASRILPPGEHLEEFPQIAVVGQKEKMHRRL